jgi:hypothetical protein
LNRWVVVLGLFISGLALTFQTAHLGLETQRVMAVRLMKLRGATEARLMISDKLAATAEASSLWQRRY